MKKKNSLIELYRFIFSINVVKNHGYFPYQGQYFSPGAYSVEFFFVLTGFLLIKSIDKFKNFTAFKGCISLLWKKLYTLGIPLVAGLIFNIIYKVSVGELASGIWMYLWYIHDMLIVIIFYFFIRRLVKNDKAFIAIVTIVALACNILHFTETFYSWGWFRSFGSISVGILLSYLPPLSDKLKKYIWVILVPVMIAVIAALVFPCPLWGEIILNNLLYPSLIYLSFQTEVSSKVMNYLGSLSFGLYAFQSVARCAKLWGVSNLWTLFIIILIPTLIDSWVKILIKNKNSSKFEVS